MQQLREKDDAMKETAAAIPTRAEVKVEDTWDLTATYESPEKCQADFVRLREEVACGNTWKGRVGESATTLRDVLEMEKSLDVRLENLRGYAPLQCGEEPSDAARLAR